jgi:hypothetical protein
MSEREIVYDDFEEGRVYPPYDFTVTAADRAAFESCVADAAVLRQGGAPLPQASATGGRRPLSALVLNTFKVQRASFRMPEGVLHARETLTMHAPAYEDEPLRIAITVKSKYRKNDRPFVVLDLALTRIADGAPIMTVERTLCWPR